MNDDGLIKQGGQLEYLVPKLMRSLFTLDPEDPAMDLPVAQLRVCAILSNGPLAISALARELNTSVSAGTQIADRLESSGLVERIPGRRDRRIKNLRLTERGADLIRDRRKRRVRRAVQVLRRMSPAARARAIQGIRTLLAATAASAPETAAGTSVRDGF